MPGDEGAVGVGDVDLGLHRARLRSRSSENRATRPSSVRSSAGTRTSTAVPTWIRETADSGTGSTSRSRSFSASRTTGIACVLDDVPAWIIAPVSA